MLFEAACFDGTNIRLTSKRLGHRTDASGKFEKGLDPNNAQAAIDRACQLMEELGAGEVVGGMVDVYSKKKEPVRVGFDPEKINELLGTELTKEEMLAYLEKVECITMRRQMRLLRPHSGMIFSGLPIWRKRWPDFTDMTTFPLRCRREKPQPGSCLSNCGLKRWPEMWLSSADFLRECATLSRAPEFLTGF